MDLRLEHRQLFFRIVVQVSLGAEIGPLHVIAEGTIPDGAIAEMFDEALTVRADRLPGDSEWIDRHDFVESVRYLHDEHIGRPAKCGMQVSDFGEAKIPTARPEPADDPDEGATRIVDDEAMPALPRLVLATVERDLRSAGRLRTRAELAQLAPSMDAANAHAELARGLTARPLRMDGERVERAGVRVGAHTTGNVRAAERVPDGEPPTRRI